MCKCGGSSGAGAAACCSPPPLRIGLIADIQYSTAQDSNFTGDTGQIGWALTNPARAAEWPKTYSWPTHRRYAHSLRVLQNCLALWAREKVGHAIVLGDVLDKTALAAEGELDRCLATVAGAFRAAPRQYHFLFGNGDAQLLKRAGWVAQGFAHGFEPPHAHPSRTASTLYYSTCPSPGTRLVFLDTYDVALGQPGLRAPRSKGDRIECEASSEEAWARARDHLAKYPHAGKWPVAWEELPALFPGSGALEEALAAQPYNGGLGAAQMAWLKGALSAAQAAGEAVFVFGHCPAHPFTCKPDGLQWWASELRATLEGCAAVQAYISGHDHDGGYFCSPAGVHYLVPPAPLESSEDECFGILALGPAEWELEWWGKQPPLGCGTLRGGAWPSGCKLPYRHGAAP